MKTFIECLTENNPVLAVLPIETPNGEEVGVLRRGTEDEIANMLIEQCRKDEFLFGIMTIVSQKIKTKE